MSLPILETARTTSGVTVATTRFVLEARISPTFANPDASESFLVHFFEREITGCPLRLRCEAREANPMPPTPRLVIRSGSPRPRPQAKRNPPKSAEELLATFESQGLPQTVTRLREFIDLL